MSSDLGHDSPGVRPRKKADMSVCALSEGDVWETIHHTPPTAVLLPSVCTVHLCASLMSSVLVTDAPTFALAQSCAENKARAKCQKNVKGSLFFRL